MQKLSMSLVLRTALRIFGYLVAFGFIGFMLIPGFMGLGTGIRVPIVGMLIVAAAILLFVDGSYRGERDATMSETLEKLTKNGQYKPSPLEEAQRFDRRKGLLAAAIAALPLFLIALYVALTAQPYAYTVQDLPSWIVAYTNRPEIGGALGYMMGEQIPATLTDYFRIATRFMLFPYVGLIGTMSDEMSLLFDRISPALSLILPLMAAIGYQFGPSRRRKSVKLIEQAKNTPRKRLKKDRKKGGAPKEKKQLV